MKLLYLKMPLVNFFVELFLTWGEDSKKLMKNF